MILRWTRFWKSCVPLSHHVAVKKLTGIQGKQLLSRSQNRSMQRSLNNHTITVDLLNNESVQKYICRVREEYKAVTCTLQNADLTLSDSERRHCHQRRVELLPIVNAFMCTEDAAKELQEVESFLQSTYKLNEIYYSPQGVAIV